jgi:S1-C subfamily serine protease
VSPDLVDINTDLSYLGEEAAGTGIVLTSNGLVLTNNHVINGATSIKARDIGNNRTYTAVVVGYVESSDVAVIQLQGASGLKTATLGHSSGVKTGTPVVAIGNAGGVGGSPSVAPGTITATNQSITASDEGSGTSEKLVGLLETDADIQPGDSGGSLVNVDGQVIGMDTAASEGFSFNQSGTQGFAIPVDTATVLASQIEGHHGSATVHIGATAFLGVAFTSAAVGASTTTISKVIPATAAQAVGLAAGDVITSFGGHPVSDPSALTELLVSHHPGDRVPIAWTTPSGQSRTATVTLGAGPAA